MLIITLPYSSKPIQQEDFCEGRSRLAENHNSPGKECSQLSLQKQEERDSMPSLDLGFLLLTFDLNVRYIADLVTRGKIER